MDILKFSLPLSKYYDCSYDSPIDQNSTPTQLNAKANQQTQTEFITIYTENICASHIKICNLKWSAQGNFKTSGQTLTELNHDYYHSSP